MQRKLLTPPRHAAVAALALGGLIAGPSMASAGDCVSYTVWIHGNQQGPIVGDKDKHCAHPTYWNETVHTGRSQEINTTLLPPGTPSGGGVFVWVPAP